MQNVQASATLTDTVGAVIGAPIVFSYSLSGQSAQTSAGTINTNSSGIASVTRLLASPECYEWYAAFNGFSGELASSGFAYICTNFQDSTSTTIMISPSNPIQGDTVYFSGVLTDTTTSTGLGSKSVVVILDASAADTAITAFDGSYNGNLTSLSVGNHSLTAVFSGTVMDKSSSSSTINFAVSASGGPPISGAGLNPMLIVGAAVGLGAAAYLMMNNKF